MFREPPASDRQEDARPRGGVGAGGGGSHRSSSAQSRRGRPGLKRQESIDVSSPSPAAQTEQKVTEKIKFILQTPKEKRRMQNNTTPSNQKEQVQEAENQGGILNVVEETISNIFEQVDKAVYESTLKIPVETEEDSDEESEPSPIRIQSTRSSQLRKQSSKLKLKNLPNGRLDELRLYSGQVVNGKPKKSPKKNIEEWKP